VAERNFMTLLREMQPYLDPHEWVFCTVDPSMESELVPIASFQEREGRTIVIEDAVARAHGLDGQFPSRLITLRVYSDLNAVGFLAAITTELARHGIATNAFSAINHDHLFVPSARAEEAIRILTEFSLTTR
jgi:hypothetical protein